MNTAARYSQTQQQTASNERLMVMLFERALRDIRSALRSLEENRRNDAVNEMTHASDIVIELRAVLDHSRAPELCAQLSDVYLFVVQRLIEACRTFDPARVREAERAFEPLVDAFSTAVGSTNLNSW